MHQVIPSLMLPILPESRSKPEFLSLGTSHFWQLKL